MKEKKQMAFAVDRHRPGIEARILYRRRSHPTAGNGERGK